MCLDRWNTELFVGSVGQSLMLAGVGQFFCSYSQIADSNPSVRL